MNLDNLPPPARAFVRSSFFDSIPEKQQDIILLAYRSGWQNISSNLLRRISAGEIIVTDFRKVKYGDKYISFTGNAISHTEPSPDRLGGKRIIVKYREKIPMPTPRQVVCFQFTTSKWDTSQRRTALEQLKMFKHPSPLAYGGSKDVIDEAIVDGRGVHLFIPGGHTSLASSLGKLCYWDGYSKDPVVIERNADIRHGSYSEGRSRWFFKCGEVRYDLPVAHSFEEFQALLARMSKKPEVKDVPPYEDTEAQFVARAVGRGLGRSCDTIRQKYRITGFRAPNDGEDFVYCDGITIGRCLTPDPLMLRLIVVPRDSNPFTAHELAQAGRDLLSQDVSQDVSQTPVNETNIPQAAEQRGIEGEKNMKKYVGWITARPVSKDGETTPAVLVADLTPVIEESLDRARTAFTAQIAQNEKIAHVLQKPASFVISVQEVAPSLTF